MRKVGFASALCIALIWVAGSELSSAQQRATTTSYALTNLGTLGGSQSAAYGINNLGWVTGAANLEGDQTEHPVLWRNRTIVDLGTLGGDNGSAGFPLKNNLGLVSAFAQTSETDPRAENWNFACSINGNLCQGTNLVQHGYLWVNGWKVPMPTLGGNNGAAWGANDWGEVVGLAETATVDSNCVAPQVLDYEAVLWTPLNNRMQALSPFPGDTVGAAVGINDYGQVVGATGSCAPVSPAIGAHAVLWENGKVKDLGSLGGAFSNVAYAINNHGQVVGISDLTGDTTAHAFLWEKGAMRDLGTLPGDFFSVAFSINNKKQVVGESCDVNFNCRAFLWQSGTMIDLNSVVSPGSSLYLLSANDLNDHGDVVGQGFDLTTGAAPAFLATTSENDGGDISAALGANLVPRVVLPEKIRKSLQARRGFIHLASAQSNSASSISVTISPTSATLQISASQVFTATVSNDPSNSGVSWKIGSACDFGPACRGTFSQTSSTSATYVAPSEFYGGAITITATSVADSTQSASASVTMIASPGFSLSPSSASVTLTGGAQTTDTITITPQNGSFTTAIQLSCTVTGSTPLPTCSLSPGSVTPGANAVTSTLTITAPSQSAKLKFLNNGRPMGYIYATFLSLPLALIASGLTPAPSWRQNKRLWLLGSFLLAMVTLSAGCGGGSNNQLKPAPLNYTITVTATSGATQQSTQVTLTVQ